MERNQRSTVSTERVKLKNSFSSEYCSGYGSTSLLVSGNNMDESTKQVASTLTNGDCVFPDQSTYRVISSRGYHIPRRTRKWSSVLKELIQLKYRRVDSRSNSIHTTKYTILSFVPRNLFEQFHRFANLYFLLVIILNFIPAVGAFAQEITWIPLFCILVVTAFKDGYEDLRRYHSDREINGKLCQVFNRNQNRFVQVQWKDVRLGDFIRLSCDEVIPADIVLLQTSDEDGLCYVQTSNLDGETTLKQRHVPDGILQQDMISSSNFHPSDFNGELYCEQPNKAIDEYKGYIVQADNSIIALGRANILLRGCTLRNTDFVTGIVVYAGHETKAMLNNSGHLVKRSKLEKDINAEIVSQVAILFVLCLIAAVGSGIWTANKAALNIVYLPFISGTHNFAFEAFIRFWTFLILLQVIIPISLYITMEGVKLFQTIIINWDLDMYYEPADKPFQCRALNINEDLGQIEYVFTDKTGTLTENEMIFRCCCIAGNNYPHGLIVDRHRNNLDAIRNDTNFLHTQAKLTLDATLQKKLLDPSSQGTMIDDFFIAISVCNTVVVTHRSHTGTEQNGNEDNMEIFYEAQSSDEYALVEAARSYGYVLLSRSPSLIRLQTPHRGVLELQLLNVLEFTPERKRMSVIVRSSEEGIVLYSKGADSVMYGRLSEDTFNCHIVTQQLLNQYARRGLRTLCIAKKVISEKDYNDWNVVRKRSDIDLLNRDQMILESNSAIETELQLLGATGVEDRLQDKVPHTIQALQEAGMKVWVLTGDKKETAMNVGYSSCLLNQNVDIITIQANSEEECYDILKNSCQQVSPLNTLNDDNSDIYSHVSSTFNCFKTSWMKLHSFPSNKPSVYQFSLTDQSRALVIDGNTLVYALKKSCSKYFLSLAKECSTVVCCRAAPLEKAAVVKLVKDSGSMTLAIGDGANDVSMIQQANVGIGIAGKEGIQAVLASDFSMARFHYIKKLLLVHGHWCYSRLANMMLYFFYKNVLYALLFFWFQLFNGFSGSYAIDGINSLIYNLLFTSVPIIIVAVADQDVLPDTLMNNRQLYKQGQYSQVYTRLKFWISMLEAFYNSAVVFFVPYGIYYDSTIGVSEFGFIINTSAVLVANLYLAVEIQHWTILHHLSLWGSCVVLFVFNYIYCAYSIVPTPFDPLYVLQMLSKEPRFWLILVVTPVIALLPKIICKYLQEEFFPTPVQKARKAEKTKSRTTSNIHVSASSIGEYLPTAT